MNDFPVDRVRSYVLRSRMTPAQKKAYEAYGGRGFVIPVPEGEPSPLKLPELFSFAPEKYIVDIGFGMGKSTAFMAEKNPRAGYIGIEVHTPGVARLLWEIENRRLQNIRIIHADAFTAVRDFLPPARVDGFHIFFPDPWPKKRHHKRRLVSAEFLGILAGCLRPKGYVYIVTDWDDYAERITETLADFPAFASVSDNDDRIPWRPETAFEKKGRLAGRKITEIFRIYQERE